MAKELELVGVFVPGFAVMVRLASPDRPATDVPRGPGRSGSHKPTKIDVDRTPQGKPTGAVTVEYDDGAVIYYPQVTLEFCDMAARKALLDAEEKARKPAQEAKKPETPAQEGPKS